jgi:hypothetical protein|tara:strand:+ start:2150 stop:2566 length:417 start_codon:yes stop_codon:yes gene_type:complete
MDEEIVEAIEEYAMGKEAMKALYEELDKLFAKIHSHMTHVGASRLETDKYSVTIPTKRSYDPHKFASVFGETMDAEALSEYLTPEHEEIKLVPAKVNGTKVKKMWNMGDDVVTRLESTIIPPRPEIKVEAKKKKEQAL